MNLIIWLSPSGGSYAAVCINPNIHMWYPHATTLKRHPGQPGISLFLLGWKRVLRAVCIQTDTILRRTLAVLLQTRSWCRRRLNTLPAPAASIPACGTGARRPPTPGPTTPAGRAARRPGPGTTMDATTVQDTINMVGYTVRRARMLIRPVTLVCLVCKQCYGDGGLHCFHLILL